MGDTCTMPPEVRTGASVSVRIARNLCIATIKSAAEIEGPDE